MKLTHSLFAVLLLLPAARVSAHDGVDDGSTSSLATSSGAEGNVVEASAVVPGTVSALKRHLYRLDRWPLLFSDLRAVAQKTDGTVSIDFVRFGHAHDFRFVRTGAGVTLELAHEAHGAGRLEYALQPLDATHSRLVVRFVVGTPPQLTSEQMVALLQSKATADLNDFVTKAPTR